MSTAEIQSMSQAERLEAMDNLWDALTNSGDEVKSPDWHENILKSRSEKMESDEAKYYTLEEVKKHFKNV